MVQTSVRWLAVFLVLLGAACAHTKPKPKPNLDLLRKNAEAFHRMLRWGDGRSAAGLVAEERRMEFLKATIDDQDEETLKITEYELVDLQAKDGKAQVLSKITWHRLPSVTTSSEAVVIRWEARDTAWVILSIEGGPRPLAPLDPAPKPAP